MFNRLLTSKKSKFKAICRNCGLKLDYKLNKMGLPILEEVFVNRNYADYFPFYANATIVDIGAHFGYFSLFAAKNLGPDAHILALEPATENFNRLKANIETNQIDNVIAIQAAVADQDGELDLYLGRTENHSIFQSSNGARQKVKALKLETLLESHQLPQIDFLKIDCEGAEYAILFNTPATIFDRIKTISMEFHDLKDQRYTGLTLADYLRKRNFEIVKFQHGKTHQNKNYGWIIAAKEY